MENKAIIEEEKQAMPLEEFPKNNTNAALVQTSEVEISVEDLDLNEDPLTPKMNVSLPERQTEASQLITDQQYLGVLTEIIDNIREDRKQVSDYIDNMADMVINDGDATTSSKEALVNLVKIKTDLQDKMLKAADLMTRLKLKNTYAYSGAHLNAMQQNNYNFSADTTDFSRRELIKAINQAKKKKDK